MNGTMDILPHFPEDKNDILISSVTKLMGSISNSPDIIQVDDSLYNDEKFFLEIVDYGTIGPCKPGVFALSDSFLSKEKQKWIRVVVECKGANENLLKYEGKVSFHVLILR